MRVPLKFKASIIQKESCLMIAKKENQNIRQNQKMNQTRNQNPTQPVQAIYYILDSPIVKFI